MLITLVVFLLGFSFYFYHNKVTKNVQLLGNNNGKVSALKDVQAESEVISPKVMEDISIYYGNEKLNFKSSVLEKYNRYYIPASQFTEKLGFKYEESSKKIKIALEGKEIAINLVKNTYDTKEGKSKSLRVEPISVNNELYLSLFDLMEIFDLKTRWFYDKKEIHLYKNLKGNKQNKYDFKKGKLALIRLEDVTAGMVYTKSDNLEKMRIVTDFLYENDVEYNVAWIPRYVNPKNAIDNDLSSKDTIENADFLFTLDYMINRNGVIGLHGYTHQNGDSESVIGTEFSDKSFTEEKDIRNRIESAISAAKKLNISYGFFESPHYSSTKYQQSIIEEYFNYMYEPCAGIYNSKPVVSPRNKRTLYIPAPLSYVKDKNVDEMIASIKNNNTNKNITSFFYHPSKELENITLDYDANGNPTYNYDTNSMLHKLLGALSEKGYKPIKITDIK